MFGFDDQILSDSTRPTAATLSRGSVHGARVPRGRSAPRRHDPPNHRFDRAIAGIYATWRTPDGRHYASAAIARVAKRQQFPARFLNRHLTDAFEAKVPLARIRELPRQIDQRIDELAAEFHRLPTSEE